MKTQVLILLVAFFLSFQAVGTVGQGNLDSSETVEDSVVVAFINGRIVTIDLEDDNEDAETLDLACGCSETTGVGGFGGNWYQMP